MSSDADKDHQRCQPKKRYKQFQNAPVNLHPKKLKRWESKIDFSSYAGIYLIKAYLFIHTHMYVQIKYF